MASGAAIVSVGNELLYGETVDTNAAWIGRTLAERGISVVRGFTVGDDGAAIREALARAVGAAELVIVTGGLGPTPDDLTKPTVAAWLGRDLVVDQAVRARLRERFRNEGDGGIPPLSEGQAEIPEGARVLRNPVGTAPGLVVESGEATIVLLPGVPSELRAILEGDLAVLLDGWGGGGTGGGIHHTVVHTTGIAETRLAEALEARLEEVPESIREGIDLAYLPDVRGVDLRFTVRGLGVEEAEARIDRLTSALDDVLEPWRFEAPSGDMAAAVLDALRNSGRTLAVAESCTGGLLSKRLTDPPGASDVFLGGIVSYANEVKVEQLGVDAELLERSGAVSEPVVRAMAAGVAERFGADAAISITGVAGPGGGTEKKPVGTVWIGISVDGACVTERHDVPGGREAVRERSVQAALTRLHRRLTARED